MIQPAASAAEAPPAAIHAVARRRIPLTFGLLGFVGLVLFPVVGVLFLGLDTARRNTFDLLHDQIAQYIAAVEQRIRQHLDPVSVQSQYLAATIAAGGIDPRRRDQWAAAMKGALSALPQVRTLAFVDDRHRVVRVNRDRRDVDLSDWSDDAGTRRMVAEARSRTQPSWGEFFYAESTRRTLLNLRTPVWREGRFLGVLVAVVAINDLSSFLASAPGRHMENAYILYGRDQVLATPRPCRPSPA